MKRVLLSSLMVLMAACAAQPGPYQFNQFWPVDCATATAPDGIYQSRGNLDVGPGAPVGFIIGTTINGTVAQPATEVNTIVLEPANRNQGVIKQAVVTYKLSRSLGSAPAPYVINMTAPLEGETFTKVQVISPELGDLLVNGLSATTDLSDTVEITVNVEFRGTYSGDGHAFTTGSLDFPILAFKSGDCPGATRGGGGGADGGTATTGTLDTSCYYAGQDNGFACIP